jgi:uncharacterized membrane protein SpoIIM required for sporulation
VSREVFEQRHEPQWQALEKSLTQLEGGARSREAVPDFPELYRQVCHHLALARHRRYGADLELRLNRLVLRGHQQLYQKQAGGLAPVFEFARSGFPRLVREEGRLVGAAAILMFGYYIRNNISIAFRTFAGGILGGVGSIFFLVYNGLVIGTVMGHIRQMGYGGRFFPFVIGHGAFELTAIVLAGAAGLRMGLALLSPGRVSRGQALLLAGRTSLRMLYGAAAMLVLAAFLEAFWSPLSQPAGTKYGVGIILWGYVFSYFLLAGRQRRGS